MAQFDHMSDDVLQKGCDNEMSQCGVIMYGHYECPRLLKKPPSPSAPPARAQQAGLTRFMLRNINWIN